MPSPIDNEQGEAVPHWRDEVVSAVEAWLNSEGGGGRRARWSRIGRARPEKPGWLTVDGRGATVNPDELDGLQVAGPDGPQRGRAYGVIEAVQEGELLRVRVAAHVSSDDLHLWATRQPRGFLIESLRDGLRSLTDPGMADALANGRLTELPDIPHERDLPGLNPEQRQVYAACRVPGLHLVWGPPGTGKTKVLQRAITDLLKADKRILLVSGTNIAVDNALEGVASDRQHRAGELVRVGTPHLPAVADDPTVSLPKLVAGRHQAIEAERAGVERLLLALQAKAARLEELEHRLAGFDFAAYQAARRVLEAQTRIGDLQQQAAELTEDLEHARAGRSSAVAELERAGANWVAITAARQHLEEAIELRRQLDDIDGEVRKIEAKILKLDGRRRSLVEQLKASPSVSPVQWLRHSKERRRLRHEEEAIRQETGHLFDRYRGAKDTAEHQRSLLEPRIAEHRRRAEPVDESEVQRRQAELDAARDALKTAGARVHTD